MLPEALSEVLAPELPQLPKQVLLAKAELQQQALEPLQVAVGKAEAVQALDALTQLCGIQVVEFSPAYLNLSRASPCFAGFDPNALLPRTDLCLLLDVDVPWLPQGSTLRPDTQVIQIDVDPVKKDFPMWGFATDLRLQADCALALRDIHDAVLALADAAWSRATGGSFEQASGGEAARME